MRWLWHTWRVMYHSIHDWNWSWNHWTSRQPALGPWPGDSLVDRALAAASCQLSPQLLEVSPSSSSVLAGAVQLYSVYTCTVPGPDRVCPGLYRVRGPGLGPGVISLDTASVVSTRRVWQSVLLQCYYRVRESPAQGSVHQLAPEPSVRACALCVHRNWKWKFLKETFALIVTEDQVKLRLLLTAKHISNSISEERRFPNS